MSTPTETLDKLFKLIDDSPGFAGLSTSIQTLSQLSEAEDGDTRKLTSSILRDAALTSKLLRLANSCRNSPSGRNVSTIDQAIVILGINTVKSVALSLALLDTLSNVPQARQLHAEIAAAYFCGSLNAELTRLYAARFSLQEAQVCGLLQNLGRMMALYHLYEEIEQSRGVQAEQNLTEEEAIRQTLGISFIDINASIAQRWNLPDVLQQSLAAKLEKTPPRTAANALAWHQLCSLFSRRVTDVLFRLPENRERVEINNEIEYFRTALHLKPAEVHETIARILENTQQSLSEITHPCTLEEARLLLRKASERVMSLLSSQDSLTQDNKRIEGRTPIEICQQVLRQIHDAFGFDHTLLCLPDGSTGLIAVAGVGGNANQIAAKFRCQGQKPDLFRLIVAKKADLYVADTQAANIAPVIPDWYPSLMGARSALLLTIAQDQQFLGLLYGDYLNARPDSPITPATQEQIKNWREQLRIALLAKEAKPAKVEPPAAH